MSNSQELGEVHSTSDLDRRNHLLCLSYRVNRANHDSASTVAAWFGYHTTLYVAFLRGLDAPLLSRRSAKGIFEESLLQVSGFQYNVSSKKLY